MFGMPIACDSTILFIYTVMFKKERGWSFWFLQLGRKRLSTVNTNTFFCCSFGGNTD